VDDDPLQPIREHITLPSDVLRMARQNNPDITITLDYAEDEDPEPDGRLRVAGVDAQASPLELVVVTKRGTLRFRREFREDWLSVFQRAGLLQR
jgi:hypothetical protein